MTNTAQKNFVQPLTTTKEEPITLLKVRETVLRYRTLTKVREPVKEPRDIAALFRRLVPNNVQEHVCLFCLDGNHNVVSCSTLFTGTANYANVHPREIFQMAVVTGAVAIIIAHNHPTGKSEPSSQDKKLTKRIRDAGEILGIRLLDHLIVTDTEFNSAAESGWI